MSTSSMGQSPDELPQPGTQSMQDQPPYGTPVPQCGMMPYLQGGHYGPPQPQETSGIAIAALCTFWVPLVGLILSIVGLVKTGAGKKKGRGIAIAALVLSLLVLIGAIGNEIGFKTSMLDPGCTKGKSALTDDSKKWVNDPVKRLQNMITQLNAAAASSHRSDVKAAMQAMSDDYHSLLTGVTAGGSLDPLLQAKFSTDAQQVVHLCNFGSN